MTGGKRVAARTGLIVAWSALLCLAVARPAVAGAPTARVKGELDEITAVVRDPGLQGTTKQEERKARVKRLILRWFDLREMARRSLGAHWEKRSEQERGEFVDLFGDLFVESYSRLVVDHLGDQRVEYLSEAVDGSTATVRTKFLSKRDEPTFVNFGLLRRDDSWAAYDVVIDDVSIVNTYRTQFNKIIRTQSYEALVKKMRLKQEAEGLASQEHGAR
jgi:phospholipid transport system substrate-binding protein